MYMRYVKYKNSAVNVIPLKTPKLLSCFPCTSKRLLCLMSRNAYDFRMECFGFIGHSMGIAILDMCCMVYMVIIFIS